MEPDGAAHHSVLPTMLNPQRWCLKGLLAWQIASEGPVLEPQPSQERRRWCLFRCRRPPTDEDIFGKKWVTLTDPAGARCAPCSVHKATYYPFPCRVACRSLKGAHWLVGGRPQPPCCH